MAPWPPWDVGSPSSGRTRPAKIDSPAASADVSPSRRNWFVVMFQTVSWAACQTPPVGVPFIVTGSVGRAAAYSS